MRIQDRRESPKNENKRKEKKTENKNKLNPARKKR